MGKVRALSFHRLGVIALLVGAFTVCGFNARAEITTVPHVEVGKYLGDWFQIAHIPLIFEGGNCACARQRLAATATAGVISVFNSCNDKDASGKLRTIKGTASSDDPSSNSKFTVSFEGVPFKGSYWIIEIDAMYRYAVVTDSGGDALYILSKTPVLDQNLYKEAVAAAARQVDISKLVVTDQKNCSYPR